MLGEADTKLEALTSIEAKKGDQGLESSRSLMITGSYLHMKSHGSGDHNGDIRKRKH